MDNRKASPNDNPNFETSEPIPEGSRFDKYIKDYQAIRAKELTEETFKELDALLKAIINDIMTFLLPKGNPPVTIRMELVYTSEEFEEIQRSASRNPKIIKPPKAKIPIYAFVVHNKVLALIYIDVGGLSSLGSIPTFIFNYVATVGHEVNHVLYPSKGEQEIHYVDCPFLEKFLGCKLPEEFKNLKTSDYTY
jgi:hypothetical protein